MKVLIYEAHAGYAPYSTKLCNYLAMNDKIEVYYLTCRDNKLLNYLCSNVNVISKLKYFDENKIYKNKLFWVINRLYVILYNILFRIIICMKLNPDILSIQFSVSRIERFFYNIKRKNTKIITTVHDVIPCIKSMGWSMKSLEDLYKISDHLIVHSESNKESLISNFSIDSSKITVIPHGIEKNSKRLDRKECRKKIGIYDDSFCVLFYGLIRESKGLDILIKALKDIENVTLVIAGAMAYGEEFSKYRNLIESNKIRTIEYIEYTPEEFRNILFQGCDLLALPYTFFQSQSGPFIQAIENEIPIIASDVSNFKEYITKYDIGLIFEPFNIDDCNKKINQIISDREAYFKYKKNLKHALLDNCWENVTQKYLNTFKEEKK